MRGEKSLGSKDNVTYTVNDITSVNISATYIESKRLVTTHKMQNAFNFSIIYIYIYIYI